MLFFHNIDFSSPKDDVNKSFYILLKPYHKSQSTELVQTERLISLFAEKEKNPKITAKYANSAATSGKYFVA